MSKLMQSPFELKQSFQLGRYLVAKEDISAGQLVFKEYPVFVFSELNRTGKVFTCLTCSQIVEKRKAVSCTHCKWTFCSRRCSKDRYHRQLECDVLEENKVMPSRKANLNLFLIRILQLKDKDPNKWNQILNLCSTFGEENSSRDKYLDINAPLSQKFLKEECNIDVDVSLIKQLINILRINAFSLVEGFGDKNPKKKKINTALYGTACLLPHGCAPNLDWCRNTVDKEDDCSIALISRRDIAAGERVTLPYSEDHSFKGTNRRRSSLLKDYFFVCECSRCTDPTELGTYFSGIKCSSCEDGWLLPNCYYEDERYTCDNCGVSLARAEVEICEESFNHSLTSINAMPESPRRKLLSFLISNATSQYRLHPNHYFVIKANEIWLAAQNLEILMETNSESESLYFKMMERAEQNREVAQLFGSLSRRGTPRLIVVSLLSESCANHIGGVGVRNAGTLKIKSDSSIALTTIRYYFKSRDYISIGKDVPNLDLKIAIIEKIVKHLQICINQADPKMYGEKTRATVTFIRKLYDKWNSRLSKCLAKSLK